MQDSDKHLVRVGKDPLGGTIYESDVCHDCFSEKPWVARQSDYHWLSHTCPKCPSRASVRRDSIPVLEM